MAPMNDKKNWRTEPRGHRKWTVMVYMAADKNAELDAVAVQDLREMESGANDDAHVVVQINRAWPDSFQRYEIRPSNKDPGRKHGVLIESDDDTTNMGAKKTLEDFLTWATKMFPAENYFLVLWGHAYGLGFGRDHGDELTLRELRDALGTFQRERNVAIQQVEGGQKYSGQSDGRLELLGTNACAMSYLEAAWELRASARYLVASQISVPFAGWPYESILRRVDNSTDPEQLGRLVIDLYVGHYNSLIRGERVAMSLLKLQNLEAQSKGKPNLKELIGQFADEIRAEAFANGKVGAKGRGPVRDTFIGAAAGDVRPLIDLHDLCEDFGTAESLNLQEVAKKIRSSLDTVIVHRDQHPDLEDLKGIGIFAPFVTDEADLKRLQLLEDRDNANGNGNRSRDFKEMTGQKEYESLSIFEGLTGAWPRLVYDDLRQEISPELLDCIAGIDATDRVDRGSLAQIVLGIDSAFNKLDRVLSAARTHVDECLRPSNGTAKRKVGKSAVAANGRARKFGLPWLKLIQPVDIERQLQVLRQHAELKKLRNGSGAAKKATALADGDPALLNSVVDFFTKVENAIGEVERAARRGLTHPTLGLGPSSPGRLGPDVPPKAGHGPDVPPKAGHGPDVPPKAGHGPDVPPKAGHGETSFEPSFNGTLTGDLRVDLALARVNELFQQVGQALKVLEQATLEVETTARTVLASAEAEGLTKQEMMDAAAEEIVRSFRILEDASANSRRTVRRVLGHPLYGLGPGSIGIGLEERQALAVSGGLDRRNLRLL
jgi:Clostripain family